MGIRINLYLRRKRLLYILNSPALKRRMDWFSVYSQRENVLIQNFRKAVDHFPVI